MSGVNGGKNSGYPTVYGLINDEMVCRCQIRIAVY